MLSSGNLGPGFIVVSSSGDTPASFAVDTALVPFQFLNGVFHSGEDAPIEHKNNN